MNKTVSVRQHTHGGFAENAQVAQELKRLARRHWVGESPTMVQAEAIEAICVKLSRIIVGNADIQDHWEDISGYAQLVVNDTSQADRERAIGEFKDAEKGI